MKMAAETVFVIWCFLCVQINHYAVADAVEIKLHISDADSNIKCDENKEYPTAATVLEDEEFHVNVLLGKRIDPSIDFLLCSSMHDSVEITTKPLKNSSTVFISTPPYNNSVIVKSKLFRRKDLLILSNNFLVRGTIQVIEIVKATASMAGTWNCTILTDSGYQGTRPRVDYSNKKSKKYKKNYAVATCFIKMHVRVKETPQIVLVNKMIVPSFPVQDLNKPFDHYAQYNYSIGDLVDVWCIPGNKILENKTKHVFAIDYDPAAKLNVMFDKAMKQQSDLGFGFRTTLQEVHDHTTMICKCTGPHDYTIIQVKFVISKQDIYNTKAVKINGLTVRSIKQTENNFGVGRYEFNYLLLKREKVEIACETHEDNRSVIIGNDKICLGSKKAQTVTNDGNNPKIVFSICNDIRSNFAYEIYVNSTQSLLSTGFNEVVSLTVNLPRNNTVMELHDAKARGNRSSWIYYEFDEGDTVIPECYHKVITEAVPEMTYKLNGSVFTPQSINLTPFHDNIMFQCSVKEMTHTPEPDSEVYKNIYVLFRKRAFIPFIPTTPITPSTIESFPSQSENFPEWVLGILALLVSVIVVYICTVACKMRKRPQKRRTGENNYQNLHSDQSHDVPIAPYPQQWSHTEESNYHVPIDTRNDNAIYAEPVRGVDDPYAVPIPKSQRKISKLHEESPYAEIGSYQTTQIYSDSGASEYASVRELYTQVLPKHARKSNQNSYDNTFPNSPYVNSKSSEYVEPTYCQAYRK